MKPDGVHFHMLVHKRLNRWSRNSYRHGTWRNSLTSIFFWIMTFATALPALFFWNQPMVLIGLTIGFVATYVWFYFRLVRFRVPQWMVLVDGRRRSQVEMDSVNVSPKSDGEPLTNCVHVQVVSVDDSRQIGLGENKTNKG